MQRKLSNWVDSFYEYSDNLSSPDVFRTWTAISTLAGVLERKVWAKTYANLYPNLYIFLVAPPGIGKTALTGIARKMWLGLPNQHVCSSSVTKASLMDELDAAKVIVTRPKEVPATVSFNSIKVGANELGVFLPTYDAEFMGALTDIYDGEGYSETRRSMPDAINIPNPQINLLAATTPDYLGKLLPEGAWDQGFLSRVIMIYSGDRQLRNLWEENPESDKEKEVLRRHLTHDLKIIGNLYGEAKFTPEARKVINDWHMAGGPPAPEHPKLTNYNVRRTAHLLKLCLVSCVAVTNELVVSLDHVQTAMDWMIEAEHIMPDIFKALSTSSDLDVIKATWHFCYTLYLKKKHEPIPEYMLIQFLQEQVPTHRIEHFVKSLVGSKLLEEVFLPKVGKCYKPRAKTGVQ